MNSFDYVVSKIENFTKEFPQVHVRYKYEEMSDIHFIEITSLAFYGSNKEYIEWEHKMWNDFIEAYPCENICFVSDDAIIKFDEILDTEKADIDIYGSLCYLGIKKSNVFKMNLSKKPTVSFDHKSSGNIPSLSEKEQCITKYSNEISYEKNDIHYELAA